MTPRLRRFLLLVLGFAAFAAFMVLTPLRVGGSSAMVVLLAMLLGIFWQLAKNPLPWPTRRRGDGPDDHPTH